MLQQIWRKELKQFDNRLIIKWEHRENKEEQVSQKHAEWLRGVSKYCFSHSR